MAERLREALGYREGDAVRMVVDTMGADGEDREQTYPVGTHAVIDRIERYDHEQGVAFTLVIGPTENDEAIVNVFDELDGPPSESFILLQPPESA